MRNWVKQIDFNQKMHSYRKHDKKGQKLVENLSILIKNVVKLIDLYKQNARNSS